MERTAGDYLAVLRRRFVVVASTVVLFGLIVGALRVVAPESYKATAVVFLAPIIDPVSNTPLVSKRDTLVNMDTEMRLAVSFDVAEGVRDELVLRGEESSDLVGHVSTSAVQNTELLRISYEAADANTAIERASAWARSFVAVRLADLSDDRQEVADSLNTQIEAAITDIAAISADIATLQAGSDARFNAEARRDAKQRLVASLQDALVRVSSVSLNVGKVVSTPGAATQNTPIGPREAGATVVVGLIAGIGLAFVRDRADHRFHSAEDVALAGITALGEFSRTATFDAAAANRARSRIGSMPNAQEKLLVVPIDEGEAGAIVANGLARSYATAGRRVAVVATDPQQNHIERLLGVPVKPGLSDAIASNQALDVLATGVAVPVGAILAIGSGTNLPLQAGMLANHDGHELLRGVGANVDTLIIVCPPLSESKACLDLSAVGDTCVLALSAATTTGDAAVGIAELQNAGIDIAGAVLVRRD